jgi:hypothetical protein
MSEHSTPARPAPQAEVEYRDVPGFPGYRVGSDGSVWSCLVKAGRKGEFRGGIRIIISSSWHRLKPTLVQDDRLSVGLYRNRKVTRRVLSRIVLEAFLGPPPPGMQGCHNDGDVRNNCLSNLRWDTPAANEADKLRHGTRPRGARHHQAKLTEGDVREIRRLRLCGLTFQEIGRRFGITRTTACEIFHRRTWSWLE